MGWVYLANNKTGKQLPAIGYNTQEERDLLDLPEDTVEIPHVPTTGLDLADLVNKVWIPYEPPYYEKRKEAYDKELGDPGQQFDAILKALLVVVPALVDGRKLTPEEAKFLIPDPSAGEGTPAEWAGRWLAIKERFPKQP